MIKQKIVLEEQIGERLYTLECYADSPLGEIHDAICKMKAFVVQRIVDAQKSEEKPKE